jgi:hypothetical protein
MAMVSSVQLRSRVTYSSEWSLPQVAGRFAEISGSKATAVLTLTFGLVLEAQQRGEPVGWSTSTESSFYPPDAAQLGIDLAALAVVRVPKPDAIARAGEKLLRSGGFGLVVIDLGLADMPTPLTLLYGGEKASPSCKGNRIDSLSAQFGMKPPEG